LKEADLIGLQPDKIANIKGTAEALRRMFSDTEEAFENSGNMD